MPDAKRLPDFLNPAIPNPQTSTGFSQLDAGCSEYPDRARSARLTAPARRKTGLHQRNPEDTRNSSRGFRWKIGARRPRGPACAKVRDKHALA